MKRYLSLLLIVFPFLAVCQDVFKGGSKEKFEESRKKIESGITEQEKNKLEIAMRVLALSVIYERGNQPVNKKKPFDEVVRKRINGKSLPEVFSLAESFVKADHQRKIDKKEAEVKVEELKRQKTDQLKSKLNVLEARPVKADLLNGQLVIYCAFTNKSDQPISNYTTVIAYSSTEDENDGWSCSKGYEGTEVLAPQETKIFSCSYPFETAKRNSTAIKWDKMTFPITDFAAYHMLMDCYTEKLVLNGTSYALGSNEFTKEAARALMKSKDELEKLKAEGVSLDDFMILKK
ncbi:hypothetical protein [Pedobacter steynii]|uniref:Uncharacterized protein n=1 Tax=Pedobacter steynii TaxID=430522 RepID=A0A1D7QPI1_9SPHI|nr:hypothetical protein [Pedobacter steynii]AOM80525.1 hypothetical protein BFS30_27215 [Pedobacter steynii]